MNDLDECFVRYVTVSCLSGVADVQKCAQMNGCKLSESTNSYLLYLTLKKLGPSVAQKVVMKLLDDGKLELTEEDAKFEVEYIHSHVVDDDTGEDMYLVKWKGWSSMHNTWEPKRNVVDCKDAISKFHDSIKRGKTRGRKRKRGNVLQKKDEEEGGDDVDNEDEKPVDKLQELYHRLQRSSFHVTPLTIIQELENMQNDKKPLRNKYVKQGLVTDKSGELKPVSRGKTIVAPNYANKKSKSYKLKSEMVKKALKDWELKLNVICSDPAAVLVENTVDLEGPPENFVYINDYLPRDGIIIPQDPIVGCSCDDCFTTRVCSCPAASGTEFAYYLRKRVRLPPGSPIYECNKLCKCGPECPNRVVQQGRKFKVAIFRTSNGKGWGVRASQKIKKGSFVMEYVGEVITTEEAERRGQIYDGEGLTYLFDLDYNESQDCPYTVDAGFYGNVSHFVNHSCEPNLAVYCVWINTLDPHLPRIALFSTKDINKGEELSFDYRMRVTSGKDCSLNKSMSDIFDDSNHDKDVEEIDLDELTAEIPSPNISPNSEADSNLPRPVTSTKPPNSEADSNLARPVTSTKPPYSEADSNLPRPVTSTKPQDDDITYTDAASIPIQKINTSLSSPSKALHQQLSIITGETPYSPSPIPGDTPPQSPPITPYETPLTKRYRIKCQCGAKTCRGFLC